MTQNLAGKKVAILATDGFEQSELLEPLKELRAAGAIVHIIAPDTGHIQGMKHHEKGEQVKVDLDLENADPQNYDALVLPGGVANPDSLRMEKAAIDFIEHFDETGKPIGAICHGPWTLIEADIVRGRTMTSWPSLKTDLRNAGATWVDQQVVVDGNFVTSRKPEDLPAFCRELIQAIALYDEASDYRAA